MNYNYLKNSDVRISEIGLGCWAMGGLNWHQGHSSGWANVDETDIREAVDYAIDHGVTHFDNADVYGDGNAERLLAKVLGNRSTQVVIASKVGHFPGTAAHAYEPAHIRHQCEQSLINLKRDYLDIYYFHHGNFGKNDQYLDDAISTMIDLKANGKIRAIGLSAYTTADFVRLIPKIQPNVVQSWAHIMDEAFIREGTVVQQLLTQNNIPFIAFSPFNQGVLLGKYSAQTPPVFENGDHRQNAPKFSKQALEALEPKLVQLKARFGGTTEDLARVALQYLLSHSVVAGVIPGFRNKRQVATNLAAQDCPLTAEDVKFIRKVFA